MKMIYAVDMGGGKSNCAIQNNLSPTLTCTHGGEPAVITVNGYDDIAGTIDASYYKGSGNRSGLEREVVQDMSYKVRRLTPLETERLQGFPDNWTAVGIDGEGNEIKISDTQRYKACGNSVAIPCVEFVLGQIKKELDKEREK